MTRNDNLWVKIEIDSGNAAVVDDPVGTIERCLDQIRSRLAHPMDGTRCKLRDANGNQIGRYWIELQRDEDVD